MVIDMGYWSRVGKNFLTLILTIAGVYVAFRFAVFYMPFLVAFILSLMIEPIIKWVMKKTKIQRKPASILILLLVFSLLIGLIAWGIVSLIAESSNLLQNLNVYIQKVNLQIQNLLNHFDMSHIKISPEIKNIAQNSFQEFLATLSIWAKDALTGFLTAISSIPTIIIYIVISLLSLYFICTDKIYMLDQLEHHLPQKWVKKLGIHIRKLTKALGAYLKAEATLVFVSFIVCVLGLYILQWLQFPIPFPLLAALIIGFVDALPIFGSGTVMVPWAILCGIDGNLQLGIAILVVWAIMSLVRQLLEPRIVSKNIGIHPIFTLIAMYTGFKLIGVLGMLVGPIALIILKNVFESFIDKGVVRGILE